MNELKKNPVFVLIIILLVVLVAATGISFYYIGKENEEKQAVVDYMSTVQTNLIDQSTMQVSAATFTESQVLADYETFKGFYDLHEQAVASIPSDIKEEDYPTATIKVKGVGELVYKLDPVQAPQSTNNFIYLAQSGYYDGLTFHRLIPDFVAQGGDPVGDGTGGPGYSIVGEFPNNGYTYNQIQYEVGTLAYARNGDDGQGTATTVSDGYNSAGSQFFIALTDEGAQQLQGSYAPFGQLVEGKDLLKKIKKHDTESDPSDTLTIESITIDTKGKTYDEPIKIDEDKEIEKQYGLE